MGRSSLLQTSTRKFEREYKVLHLLRCGLWAVKERRTGEHWVARAVSKSSLSAKRKREELKREVAMLESSKGVPGIIQLHETCECSKDVHLVLEQCKGGNLLEIMQERGKLPEASARALFAQLAVGLAHCHDQGVVHRNIRLENIWLTESASPLYSDQPVQQACQASRVHARLAGFQQCVNLEKSGSTCGLLEAGVFTAPEVSTGCAYSFPVDVWSMGMLLCCMLTGNLKEVSLQRSQSSEENMAQGNSDVNQCAPLKRSLQSGKLEFDHPAWESVSNAAKDLLWRMLELNPKKRPNMAKVLAHPWLEGAIEGATLPASDHSTSRMRHRGLKGRTLSMPNIDLRLEELVVPETSEGVSESEDAQVFETSPVAGASSSQSSDVSEDEEGPTAAGVWSTGLMDQEVDAPLLQTSAGVHPVSTGRDRGWSLFGRGRNSRPNSREPTPVRQVA